MKSITINNLHIRSLDDQHQLQSMLDNQKFNYTIKYHHYDKESLQTDIEWLKGYNMDEQEAEKFIKYLLNSNINTPTKKTITIQ